VSLGNGDTGGLALEIARRLPEASFLHIALALLPLLTVLSKGGEFVWILFKSRFLKRTQ
jgi:hypothetical protein